MYNQEIKQRFIDEEIPEGKYVNQCADIFARIGPYEAEIGKDIAEMTLKEAIEAINLTTFTEVTTLESFMSGLRKYVKWAKKIPAFNYSDDCLRIKISDYQMPKDFAKEYFKDEADFIASIKSVRELNEGYSGPVVCAFLWLGLSIKQIANLKEGCVSFVDRKIFDREGNVLVTGFSDDIARIFELFERCNQGVRPNSIVYKDKSFDDYVKGFYVANSKKHRKPLTGMQLADNLGNMNDKFKDLGNPPKFTSLTIMRSGAMSRLYKLEQSGVDVFDKKKNCEAVEKACRISKYRSLIWQYRFYKQAFNL